LKKKETQSVFSFFFLLEKGVISLFLYYVAKPSSDLLSYSLNQQSINIQ